ncbi:hypothetical protein, partial [Pseudomonas sp. Irchel 3E19]|uniref:hypothetical protein n=1 Tax=Pseudomonas sp. Irchel 3E19 TaxID=2008981 RepID=UPI001C487C84
KKPQPATARLGTQGTQAGDAVGDGWIEFRAKTMRYFLFDKSCHRLRSFTSPVKTASWNPPCTRSNVPACLA